MTKTLSDVVISTMPSTVATQAIVSPPAASLKSRAVHAASWTILGFGLAQLLRLGSSLVLSRLLFPEAFGVMALVNVVMSGLQMFSDVGIQPALMQHRRGEDPVFVNTAWTIQVLRGFVLWVCASLLAWPASYWFQAPALITLIPVASLTAVIAGFNSTSLALLNRNLILGRQTLWELVSQMSTILVTVLWAWCWPSVWALVVGGLFGTAIKVVLSHVALPGIPHRFGLDRESARELMRFGRWIVIGTALTFFATYGDRLMLGRSMTKEQLGVYSVAQNLSVMTLSVLTALGGRVSFPLYARVLRGPAQQIGAKLRKARIAMMALSLPIPCLTVIAGKPLIGLLYDPRYHEAGWILEVLSVGVVFSALIRTTAPILLASGDSFGPMLLTMVRVVLLWSCMLVGGAVAGVHGLVIGVAIASVLSYAPLALLAHRARIWMPTLDCAALALCAISIAVGKVILGEFR